MVTMVMASDGIGFTGLPHMEHQEAHSNRYRTDVEWENFWWICWSSLKLIFLSQCVFSQGEIHQTWGIYRDCWSFFVLDSFSKSKFSIQTFREVWWRGWRPGEKKLDDECGKTKQTIPSCPKFSIWGIQRYSKYQNLEPQKNQLGLPHYRR